MPVPKKKLRRRPTVSTSRPAACAHRTYSMPSAMVKASSSLASAPASCMWYPLMLMLLNLGMCSAQKPMMSEMARSEGAGG